MKRYENGKYEQNSSDEKVINMHTVRHTPGEGTVRMNETPSWGPENIAR